MTVKSPFIVKQEFASPLMCEDVVDACLFNVPDKDKDGKEMKTVRTSDAAESLLYNRLIDLMPSLEAHYGIKYRGMERMAFEWFPEGSEGTFQSENSEFLRGKWLRTRARDLTAILFLSDHAQDDAFEPGQEVYGGKLEFTQHKFGFNPTKGTLIVFPSDPHFINVTAPVLAGDLFQVRIQISAQAPFLYNPSKYPGNYTSWFSDLI